jgi:signal transduction histidine kinase
LTRETRQLQSIAIEDARTKLNHLFTLTNLPPGKWDEALQKEAGAALGGKMQFQPSQTASLPSQPGEEKWLTFTEPLPGRPGWEARVSIAYPAMLRVQIMHQRILAAIVLLALLLALVPLLVAVLEARRGVGHDQGTRSPWASTRAAAVGFEQLARISHERSTALAQEHAARARAEADLEVNRNLLGLSVSERVRLGRELHDNICQTIYAVCLTLESVRKKSVLSPEMNTRTEQCLQELTRLNREVRAYLQDLEPGSVNGQSFTAALAGMIGSLPAGDHVQIERKLDDETLALIPSEKVAEIMNILREAVSNSLRHGQARRIILRAGRNDHAIALSVQDDGRGFTPGGPRGHGLDNMLARAASLGGNLAVDSKPGEGTRVILTLPLPPLS